MCKQRKLISEPTCFKPTNVGLLFDSFAIHWDARAPKTCLHSKSTCALKVIEQERVLLIALAGRPLPLPLRWLTDLCNA